MQHRLFCSAFAATLLSAGSLSCAAELAIDPPGFRPRPPGLHALVGGTVIPRPGVVVSNATLVISNGTILSLESRSAPPAQARVWPMTHLTIYAGFIDPWWPVDSGNLRGRAASEDLAPNASPVDAAVGPRYFGVPGQERDPGQAGPGAASPDVTPEFRMAAHYAPEPKAIQALRELGFTAAQAVPDQGIFRGQAALVTLSDAGPNASILAADTAHCVAFEPSRGGSGRGSYPRSLMGVVALIRQTFLYAEAHARADEFHRGHPSTPPLAGGFNPALESLQSVRHGTPVLMEPGSVLMLDRAAQVADEFGLIDRVFLASGGEWRRPDLVAAAKGPFIVSLDFPSLPKLPDDADWEDISLDQLRAWDWAPENPAVLRRTGADIAFTTHANGDRKAFRRNLRAALDRGLSEDDALAALTTVPARLVGAKGRLGTLEPGGIANLTIVEGSYFKPDDPLVAVWVEGRAIEFPASSKKGDSKGQANSATNEKSDPAAKKEEARDAARPRVAHSPLEGRGPIATPALVIVRNATIWTSGPEGVLSNATLIVRDGRIERVGTTTELPEGAEVIDGTGLHVTPGLIDCHSHSMILGGVNEATLPSTAMVRIGDVVNSETDNLYQQLAGGLTVANLLHGSANPIGGQNCVIKLRDGEGPEGLKFSGAPPGIKFALGENVKQSNWGDRNTTRFPQSRMGVPTFYVNRFTAAQQYAAARRHAAEDPNAPPVRRDLELDALVEILEGKRLIHCHSYRQDEIVAFLRTMESFGVRVATLQHILEGYKVADEIAAHGAGASAFADWWAYKFEVLDAIPYAGAIMRERGVNVSFNSDSSDHARRLNLEAAKAVKYGGVPPAEALKFVTLNPARQLGIAERVGSLEPGKDADFALWSGHPLDTRTVCLQTWIDGRKYFDRSLAPARAKALAEEREALIAKTRKTRGSTRDKGNSPGEEAARMLFFQRALEHAVGHAVIECQDCQLP